MIKAKSQFKQRSTANNVEIVIPVPPDADTPSFKTSIGSVKYAPERDAIVWTIKQFHGGKEYLMRAHFGLPSVSNEEDKKDKPPITVKFEIPYFTVSGIQVSASCMHAHLAHSRPFAHATPHPLRPSSNTGAIPEDYREVGLSGVAMGAIHHPERRLPAADDVRGESERWWLCGGGVKEG